MARETGAGRLSAVGRDLRSRWKEEQNRAAASQASHPKKLRYSHRGFFSASKDISS